jgi:hypothetical protein
MRWNLHGVIIEGTTNHASLSERWQASFASLPLSTAAPALSLQLDIVNTIPEAPTGEPHFRQGELLAYYLNGDSAVAYFPRFGTMHLDLANGRTTSRVVTAALDTYGVLEDLIAIGLSPHLRRQGLFLIHAFAAVQNNQAVLLVGSIGAGKTTTGMSLLDAGWQLLSNDSPILNESGEVLSYPGLLAAYPDTLARFERTAALLQPLGGVQPRKVAEPPGESRAKITIAAEQLWPAVWCERAPLRAIVFPRITNEAGAHRLEPLGVVERLRRLLPHAVEQWDRPMMPAHLALLRRAAEIAPAFILHLGPDVKAIPSVLSTLLA